MSNLDIDGQGSEATITVNFSDLSNARLSSLKVTVTNTGNEAQSYRVSNTIGPAGGTIITEEINPGESVDVTWSEWYIGGILSDDPQPSYEVHIDLRDNAFNVLSEIYGTLNISNLPG